MNNLETRKKVLSLFDVTLEDDRIRQYTDNEFLKLCSRYFVRMTGDTTGEQVQMTEQEATNFLNRLTQKIKNNDKEEI